MRWLARVPVTLRTKDAPTIGELVARGRVKPANIVRAARAVALADLGRFLLWARLDQLAPEADRLPPAARLAVFEMVLAWIAGGEMQS